MIPDIVEIRRLCASGQWIAKVENGKIFLHDTVAGETVCIGNVEVEPVQHARFLHIGQRICGGIDWYRCSNCGALESGKYVQHPFCSVCGAKMDGGAEE